MNRTVMTPLGIIEYSLTRKRVKNINLRVCPNGDVAVSAHRLVGIERIDVFVKENAEFVFRAKQRAQSRCPADRRTYTDGSTVLLWGEDVLLRVGVGKNAVTKDENGLVLTVREPENEEIRAKAMRAFYKEECKRVVDELCREVAPSFGKTVLPAITYRSMTSRWGSCNPKKNKLTFNIALATVPLSAVRYVVLHEFTHFLHADHSTRFYKDLEKVVPDWKKQKEILRKRGQILI